MARTYIKCAGCGEQIEIHGRNNSDAKRQAAWREKEGATCGACKRRQWEADNAAAAQRATESGLPELTGSPKQIAWAASIRETALARLPDLLAELSVSLMRNLDDICRMIVRAGGEPVSAETRAACEAELRDVVALIETEIRQADSAKWWIDEGRELSHTSLVREVDTHAAAYPTVVALAARR